MRAAIVMAFLAALLPGLSKAITPAEAAEGWIQLFDGESLFGWTSDGAAKWKAGNGLLISDSGAAGYLRTNMAFADFLLKCEFRTSAGGGSGSRIYLRWEKHGKPAENGYELPIDDHDAAYPAGSLLGILKANSAAPKPGEWRSLDVLANADHFIVRLDGAMVLDGKDPRFQTGYIRLQSSPGSRVEFRNLRLKPLALESLFDGANLAGWKQVPPPPAKPSTLSKLIPIKPKPKPAIWAPKDGAIRVQDGADQLETQKTFADFILQLQVRIDSKNKNHHPEGAVLFRGDPGKYESGYKLLVHNGADSPTGTLGELQAARKAVGEDKVYSTETIAAYGRHIAVWADGTLVNDYDDRRPDGIARTGPGTIALTHDPDSIFEFKNINVESLAKAAAMAEMPRPDGGQGGAGAGLPAPAVQSPAAGSVATGPVMPGTAAPGPIQIPGQAEENARRAKVSELTTKSLRTNDPHEQVRINTEILNLDPGNQVAYDALKTAREKIEKSQAQQAQQETLARQQIDQLQAKEAARRDGLQKAENALVAGDLKTAAEHLAAVRKIAPDDPEAQILSARVGKQLEDKKRIWYILLAGAVVGLCALLGLWLAGRGKKQAYLEIVSGTEQGKRFEFAGEVLHIGAVEQDGGSRNEVVVQDGERLISRFHCEIHRRGSKFYVFDVKSANGTFVDKRRIKPGKPVQLRSGSRVDLAGACSLRLRFDRRAKPDA
jgi:hypothetical protein